jgi:hypothetical protein
VNVCSQQRGKCRSAGYWGLSGIPEPTSQKLPQILDNQRVQALFEHVSNLGSETSWKERPQGCTGDASSYRTVRQQLLHIPVETMRVSIPSRTPCSHATFMCGSRQRTVQLPVGVGVNCWFQLQLLLLMRLSLLRKIHRSLALGATLNLAALWVRAECFSTVLCRSVSADLCWVICRPWAPPLSRMPYVHYSYSARGGPHRKQQLLL